MHVVVKEPGKEPKAMNIQNTWAWFLHIIGGQIDMIKISDDVVGLVLQEKDAILKQMAPNLRVGEESMIRGNAVFLAIDTNGNFLGLTETQEKYAVSFVNQHSIET